MLATRTSNDYRNILRKIPAGCVGAWLGLPEGRSQATIPDLSGNGNHGTITGASWVQLPSGIWCLSYDGINDFTSFGEPASLVFTTGDFMLESWIYVNALGDDAIIFGKENGGDQWRIDVWGDKFRFLLGDSGGGKTAQTNSTILAATWYHVLCDRNGATGTIWLNGVAQTTQATLLGDLDVDAPGIPVRAGITTGGGALQFAGRMAMTRIYNVSNPSIADQRYQQERRLFGV